MKVIQVINKHRFGGGIDIVADATISLLKKRGNSVFLVSRDSRKLGYSFWAKLRAFGCSIFSPSAWLEMLAMLRMNAPEIVHVHEVYPLISPWFLKACRKVCVPVVMTCHDYRLVCPTANHFQGGNICELCCEGREYWCIIKNCRSNIFESVAYALRSAVARKFRLFHDNVTFFIALTNFGRDRLIDAGFAEKRIVFLPNMVSIPDSPIDPSDGEYIAYAGRISPEKGIDTLLAATRKTGIPVRLAGDGPIKHELVKRSPKNAAFVGLLDRGRLDEFYRKARFLVVPSIWFETFGLVVAEAMGHCLPVIASRIGGLPELVDDGVTGLLFEPGNSKDLANKMKLLWENPDLCRQMGMAGREKAIREYSEDVYYKRLIAVYRKAIEINKKERKQW